MRAHDHHSAHWAADPDRVLTPAQLRDLYDIGHDPCPEALCPEATEPVSRPPTNRPVVDGPVGS